ncbi:type II toxin-antitoxin system Phd/YefM family antitoxin [Irregularibacter muris]|uniref:Antitoxin n=1 Tax=Irregularibacter muris TaxID=1796619 RepID=A0AAE3HEY1_9FIRM|nr:type II toxin-antitoxin system Phd/YefM family antitoxin [Irregularibacter muris]MCR1898267.1 type II toxin-antitoxin system Phd/YefM family antitoxin [Irregularibacter muris]
MPNIKPVSDLRNYNSVIKDCKAGDPVFLTKNGRGKYVLIDIEEYQREQDLIKRLSKLEGAEEILKSEE